jgi:hypothetical protein
MKVSNVFKHAVIEYYNPKIKFCDFQETNHLDINVLIPNHDDLDDLCVIQKMLDKELHTDILVVNTEGKYYLINGHHTASALILKGETKLNCKVLTI